MLIRTERLLLREYTADDLDAWSRIVGDATTMRFWPRPFTRDEALAWIERARTSYCEHGFGRWAMTLKDSTELIGDCGISCSMVDGEAVNDLGYIIAHRHWGRGYGTEAALAVRDRAFGALGLDTLHANMAFDHVASRRVAEKVGMTRVREFNNTRNRNIRTFLYRLDKPSGPPLHPLEQ